MSTPPTPRDAARPGTPAGPTADHFLRAVLQSRLLDRSRLDRSVTAAPPAARTSASALADHLVAAGDLTHYQAEKLLGGRWQGLVLGPYHLLAPLGRGGMGTVYLARDTRLSETGGVGVRGKGGNRTDAASLPPVPLSHAAPDLVGLKVLSPKRAREEEKTLARFRREMELGRHLAHPNVTRTWDTGVIDGVHYIAMEYVPGQSLRQLVGARGPLPVGTAARMFADVADGLAHAHDRGLIHRDLKPSNIMVTPDGRAKVLDLGLAILMDEALPDDPTIVGGRGYILGTMDYIAPEQTTNATDVGPWSDLYAFGCSLYFALTGVPPFPGGSSRQKRQWHRTETPPTVRALNPAVPAALSGLIEQLMAKQPADRPESAGAVRGLLLPLAGTTHLAGPPPAHTIQEIVAEVDSRAVDPSLWDDAPMAEALAAREPETLPADTDRTAAWRHLLLSAGAVTVLVLLAVLLGLLRRL